MGIPVRLATLAALIAITLTGPAMGRPSLAEATAAMEIPPAWFAETPVDYDTTLPWGKARAHIRTLLGRGDQLSLCQAVKLTYIYHDKDDMGDGHEYGMYLFIGGEHAWAIQAYEEFLAAKEAKQDRIDSSGYMMLAACYRHFGEYAKVLDTLNRALAHLPKPPWDIVNAATLNEQTGDLYAEMGHWADAAAHYRIAIELYPTSKQPYGLHLLPRYDAKAKAKLAMLGLGPIRPGQLKDGAYESRAIGYGKDVTARVTVAEGRIAGVRTTHRDNITLGAHETVPARIVAAQSVTVDGVTGATISTDAIRVATFEALQKAGLKAGPDPALPPPWLATMPMTDTSVEWRAAKRAGVLPLLHKGDLASRRRAMAMTYHYKQAGQIPKGGIGMAMFWGGEPVWAIELLEAELAAAEQAGPTGPAHIYMGLASCYRHRGDIDAAVATVERGLTRLPKGPRGAAAKANLSVVLGDLHAAADRDDLARTHYRAAIAIFEAMGANANERRTKLMARQAAKVRTKLAMLTAGPLSEAKLTDGVHEGVGIGYAGDVTATVTVAGGRVAKIEVTHTESLPSDAPIVAPQRIITAQDLGVDGVTGATVTSDAIKAATFEAVTKAGLE